MAVCKSSTENTSSNLPTSSELNALREVVTCPICLDLFDNPFSLSCGHTFCRHCLRALGEDFVTAACPTCRAFTVPSPQCLDELTANTFACELAELIRQIDERGITESFNATADECEDNASMYEGEVLDVPELKPKKPTSTYDLAWKSATIILTAGVAAAYMGYQTYQRRKKKMEAYQKSPSLYGYTCGHCLKVIKYKAEDQLRYKCGMCEDFNLCPDCFSRNLNQIHRQDHLLLKLKSRQRRQLPPGTLLRYNLVKDMCDEMDFTSCLHDSCLNYSREALTRTDCIQCSFCAQIIEGTRFKCGMCADFDLCADCEVGSEKIHDSDHVFIVIKYKCKINIISAPLVKALVY